MKRLKEAFDWRFWVWVPILALLVPFVINKTALSVNFKIVFSLFIQKSDPACLA